MTLLRHPALADPIQVRRSGRARRIALKIDPIARAATLVLPECASQAAGLDFVSAHLGWVRERLAALPAPIRFCPAAVIPILGMPHRLTPERAAKRGVWIDGDQVLVSGSEEFFPRRVRDFLKAEAKREMMRRAIPMAERLGRSITQLRVNDPKSRWGSCTSQGKLSFSWRLVLAPAFVLDYVIAHEVAHLREMNHGPAFWQLVEQLHTPILPARRWLKDQGRALYLYG